MDDAGTAPAAETPPRAPRHQGRGALPRAEAVRGSLELALSMLQLKDMAGAKTMLQALIIAAHGGAISGDHTTGQPVPPRGARDAGAAAEQPHGPLTLLRSRTSWVWRTESWCMQQRTVLLHASQPPARPCRLLPWRPSPPLQPRSPPHRQPLVCMARATSAACPLRTRPRLVL